MLDSDAREVLEENNKQQERVAVEVKEVEEVEDMEVEVEERR
jgi:hypothetical protein